MQSLNYLDLVESSVKWALHAMNIFGVFDRNFVTIQDVYDIVKEITPVADYIPGKFLCIISWIILV